MPGRDEIAHGIGQVELALGVDGLQAPERRPEQVAPGRRRSRSSPRRSRAARVTHRPPRRSTRDRRRRHGRSARSCGCRPGRTRARLRRRPASDASSTAPGASSVVSSGVSPERTSTSSAPTDRLARRTAPHPLSRAACFCTAVVNPANWSAVSGETTTTSESGSSGRAASTIQSTIRRPRIGCRCLGIAERMRVPRPPAMTTAASLGRDSDTVGTLAGAPGFEPGITGPKPVALPLGHAPVNRDAECTRTARSTREISGGRAAARSAQWRREGDDDDRQHADEHESDGHEHDDELRDGGDPRHRANAG